MLALFASLVLAQAAPGGAPEARAVLVELRAPGAPARVPAEARADGLLRAWVEAAGGLDTTLRAEDAQGARLGEDDDSGGRPAPYLQLGVHAGDRMVFVVAAKSGAGSATLHLIVLAESAEARAAAAAARQRFEELRQELLSAPGPQAREALQALTHSLVERADLKDSDALQLVLEDAAELLGLYGEHAAALTAAEALVTLQSGTLPPDSRRRCRSVVLRASALLQLGRGGEAIPQLERALAVLERTVAASDRGVDTARSALGSAYYSVGDFARAAEHFGRAARSLESKVAPDDRDLGVMRANHATALYFLGELDQARAIVERAQADLGAKLVRGSPLEAQVRTVLSAIVSEQGDLQAGRVLAEQALESARALHGPNSAPVWQAELNLALAEVNCGEVERGHATLQRIVAQPLPDVGPDHPWRLQAEANLAGVELRRGDLAAAEAILSVLQPRLDAHLPSGHALRRMVLRDRALALRGLGRVEEAARLEDDLLRQTEAVLPRDHPEWLRLRQQRGETAALLGRAADARDAADALAEGLRAQLAARALVLSSREAEAIAQGLAPCVDGALNLLRRPEVAAVHPGAERTAFELVESVRGIGVASLRTLRAARASGADVGALRDAARTAALNVARVVHLGQGADAVSAAVAQRDGAERALRDRLAGSALAPRAVTAADVAGGLGPGELAVGWWVSLRDVALASGRVEQRPHVDAFVVRGAGDVQRVDLGPLEPIAAACAAWRALLEQAGPDPVQLRAAGERLRALIVDPVRARAPDAKLWIAAPDGPLLSVPLETLPDGGDLLGGTLRVHVVHSFDPQAAPGSAPEDRVVALADPDFGARPDGAPPRWSALPGTAEEVAAILEIRRETAPSAAPPVLLRGAAATREALLAQAPGARWLHVATHGEFEAAPREGGLLVAGPEDVARELVPQTRCSLALAGSNTVPAADVTAEDLGALDLGACELAVLSACETGRGELVPGQGVASFQRALSAAGARHVLTALWRVPDAATRELMQRFYAGLWREKLEPHEALWRAQLALRARRAPARDWAAWVLSGR